MTITYAKGGANNVSAQVQEFWSPLLMDELREQSMLASLLNRDYDGELNKRGDTVKVSQVGRPAAGIVDLATGDNTFSSAALGTSQVEVKADRRITAAFELEDLIDIQSQLGDPNGKSAIRKALMDAVDKELNDYLYGLVAPTITTAATAVMNAGVISTKRKEAAQAHWAKEKGWWLLADPGYYKDILDASTLTSSDFVDDAPVIGGQVVNRRFGFNILEDATDGLVAQNTAPGNEGVALVFHPDFMYLVMQRMPTFKVSDQHANEKHGFIISVDMVVGAVIGLEGADKHMLIKTGA